MRHANDTCERLAELRELRPLLAVHHPTDESSPAFKILDKPGTPFWFAYFATELDAREAWEAHYKLLKVVRP